MIYVGQLECYEQSSELLEELMQVKMSSSQIYRVSDSYGKQLDSNDRATPVLEYPKDQDVVYIEVDGSMVFTREHAWKETKLARIFLSSDCTKTNTDKRGMILNSHYIAHLGDKDTFINKVEEALALYSKSKALFVFISDGATWIRNWIEDSFGDKAVSVLDYYHAMEYLHEFANSSIVEEQEKQQWLEKQKDFLLEGQVSQVIKTINQMEVNQQSKKKIINYYKANQNRMNYKKYTTIGAGLIGSGAIESAHRTVIQKRLKLSGQRWRMQGARHMLKLRTIKMNKNWNKVINLVQTEFKKAS